MKVIIGNNESEFEARKITIVVGNVEFEIKVNNFKQLVVNKQNYGDGESELIIKPSVSNEIRLS